MVVSWISAFAVGVKRLHDRDKNGWLDRFYFISRRRFSAASRTLASSPFSVSSLGLALSSSRSGRWSSLVSCAGPSVPTGMDPIRCNRPRHRFRCARISRSLRFAGVWAVSARHGSLPHEIAQRDLRRSKPAEISKFLHAFALHLGGVVGRPDRLPGSRLTSLADGLQRIVCDPRPRRRGLRRCG